MRYIRLFIDHYFPNWNEYINAERASLYKSASIKKEDKEAVIPTARERYEGEYPVTLRIRPHFQNKRKDLDNFRAKGLIDGLVSAGVIKNDNLTCIDRIILEPVFSEEVGVEVEIIESEVFNNLFNE